MSRAYEDYEEHELDELEFDPPWYLTHETSDAIGISEHRGDELIWLPKSQIMYDVESPGRVDWISLPIWLRDAKGIS